jgi:hypothetical protein
MALRQRIDKAWANIDVILKQRHDQLPALVAAVRGLMAFEQDVLTEVTRARAAYVPTAPIPAQAGVSEQTSTALRTLFATIERYPDITSAGNVADLQAEIERLEEMIADRRELYNDQVYRYNTRIAQVPTNAPRRSGWRPCDFFSAIRPTPRAGHLAQRGPRVTDPTPAVGGPGTANRHQNGDMAGAARRDRMGATRPPYRSDRHPLTTLGRGEPLCSGGSWAPLRPRAGQSARATETARLAGFGDVAKLDPRPARWDYGDL